MSDAIANLPSSSAFAGTSDLESSAVSTRWGTFVVEAPSFGSDSSEYNISWATRASNQSSPKSSSSRDVPALNIRFGNLCNEEQQGQHPTPAFRGRQAAPMSAPFFTNQVMVKNILNRFTKKEFTDFLDSVGLEGTYNGVYLPIGRTRKGKTSNLGYAFVDFRGMEEVDLCRSLLHGMVVGIPGQQKCIEIAPVTTHHPSRKFHRNAKQDDDEEDNYYGEEAGSAPSGGSFLGDYQQSSTYCNSSFYQTGVDDFSARGPINCPEPFPFQAYSKAPAFPAATFSQGSTDDVFASYMSPLGDYEHGNPSWDRKPVACDQTALNPRHLAPLTPLCAAKACHNRYSV